MATAKKPTLKTTKVKPIEVVTVKTERKTRSKLTFPKALTALMDKKYDYAKLSYWPDKKYIFIGKDGYLYIHTFDKSNETDTPLYFNVPWTPSQTDLFRKDWIVFKED